jgi:formamidopyrimidine-DNA glycosylase
MPELPEVETIRLGLQKKIVTLTIKDINILNQKSFQGNINSALNKKVNRIWRKAKVLGIELNEDLVILIHLKMSGQLIYEGNNKFIGGHPTKDMTGVMPNKSTRVIFKFSDNSKLYFNDQRKFGWIKLVNIQQLTDDSFLKKLGPEPLDKEFSWEIFKEKLLRHKGQAIKVAILDQQVVSGVGNIYACEALFHAKLNPEHKVSKLSDEDFIKLHSGVIRALKAGVKYGGSTKTHFVNEEGKKGFFLDYAFVYGREGEPCKICKNKIIKIKLGSRGTYFCPNCQK